MSGWQKLTMRTETARAKALQEAFKLAWEVNGRLSEAAMFTTKRTDKPTITFFFSPRAGQIFKAELADHFALPCGEPDAASLLQLFPKEPWQPPPRP